MGDERKIKVRGEVCEQISQGGIGDDQWVTVLRSHWVRACITSFTSMVPITIFSLLTVNWAAPAARASRVSRTRLPLVSVLPANLRWEQRKGWGEELPTVTVRGLALGPFLKARPQQSPSLPLYQYLYSSDVPHGTRPRLAVAVTFCTTM